MLSEATIQSVRACVAGLRGCAAWLFERVAWFFKALWAHHNNETVPVAAEKSQARILREIYCADRKRGTYKIERLDFVAS